MAGPGGARRAAAAADAVGSTRPRIGTARSSMSRSGGAQYGQNMPLEDTRCPIGAWADPATSESHIGRGGDAREGRGGSMSIWRAVAAHLSSEGVMKFTSLRRAKQWIEERRRGGGHPEFPGVAKWIPRRYATTAQRRDELASAARDASADSAHERTRCRRLREQVTQRGENDDVLGPSPTRPGELQRSKGHCGRLALRPRQQLLGGAERNRAGEAGGLSLYRSRCAHAAECRPCGVRPR